MGIVDYGFFVDNAGLHFCEGLAVDSGFQQRDGVVVVCMRGYTGRVSLSSSRMSGAAFNLQQKVNELSESARKLEKMEEQQNIYLCFSVLSLCVLWVFLWAFAPTSWTSLSLVGQATALGGAYVGIWAVVCKTVAVMYIDVLERDLPASHWSKRTDDEKGFWMGLVTLPLLLPCWCWRGKAFFGLEWFVGLDDSSLGGYRWFSQIFWISLWLVFLRLANEATIRISFYGIRAWRWFRQKSEQQQQQ